MKVISDEEDELDELSESAAASFKTSGHPCHKYFSYNKEKKKSKCLVSDCDTQFVGKNTTNLAGHLKKKHGKSEEYEEFSELLAAYEKKKLVKKRKIEPVDSPKPTKQLKLNEVKSS